MSPLSTATISGQPGPQTEFLRTAADICIYGGAAGGGKTVGLILEPLRHVGRVANFTAVFFRRTTPQITNPGGLWDESQTFYPRLGGTPHLGMREWRWPRAGKIKFSHLQFETAVYDWQGAQIALICFDELTHFTAHQFFYMVSHNRSTCGGPDPPTIIPRWRRACLLQRPRTLYDGNDARPGHTLRHRRRLDLGPERCWRAAAAERALIGAGQFGASVKSPPSANPTS